MRDVAIQLHDVRATPVGVGDGYAGPKEVLLLAGRASPAQVAEHAGIARLGGIRSSSVRCARLRSALRRVAWVRSVSGGSRVVERAVHGSIRPATAAIKHCGPAINH
jgi:hypothetical protein